MRSGSTIDAGCSGGAAAEAHLDDLGEDLVPARDVEVTDAHRRGHLADASGLGHEDDRPRRVTLGESVQHPAHARKPGRRRPHHVGHRARPELGDAVVLLLSPQPGEPPFDVADDAHGLRHHRRRGSSTDAGHGQCRRHERPSRWIDSSAAPGPQVPPA